MATTAPTTESDPLIGRLLDGRYKIVEKVASGGMGAVYRAVQQPLGRSVAIKVLKVDTDEATADAFRQRFFREASLCARLKHPNTVRIHDYGQTKDDIYYIAMEFLEGETLRRALGSKEPMAPLRAIDLMTQICASLSEAHGLGLIHRDLKPSNIILTVHADGREYANVVDFGLVKDLDTVEQGTTETGVLVGSPAYMSPEQILQGELDERSDIYSLGVILYVMLTGKKPFKQESLAAVIQRHLHVEPPVFSKVNPATQIPASLEWVTMTCLAKEPRDRFASAAELSRALRACSLEITGRFNSVEMSLTDGRLDLPPEIDSIVAHGLPRRPGARPSAPPTHPSLARQLEPSGTGTRLPWYIALASGPVIIFLLALIFLLLIGIGVVGWWRFASPSPAPSTVQPVQVAPTPALPRPAPRPAPPPAPVEEPEVEPEPAPAPRPVQRPRPRPRAAPQPRPAPRPAPRPEPTPRPAPAPQPAPQPDPVAPAPDNWGTVGDDLVNPWAK